MIVIYLFTLALLRVCEYILVFIQCQALVLAQQERDVLGREFVGSLIPEGIPLLKSFYQDKCIETSRIVRCTYVR